MRVALAARCFVMVAVVAAAAPGGVPREGVVGTRHWVGAPVVGKILVIPEDSGVSGRLEVARLDGGKRIVLASLPGVISGAAWSPRGDRIAVSFRRGAQAVEDTFILDAGGQIVARMRGSVMAGSWSTDGRYVVTDGSTQPACKNGVPIKRSLRFLVYAAGALIYDLPVRTPPHSGGARYIAESVGSVAWSPSGDRLAYVVSEYDCGNERAGMGPSAMYVVALTGGRQTTLDGRSAAKSGWTFIGSPAWAPDGHSLAFPTGCLDGANGTGCESLVVVGADGRNSRLVKRDPYTELTNSVVWPTTDTLVFGRIRATVGSGIATLDLRNGRQRWLIRARSDNESVCDYGTLKLSASGRDVVSNAWNSWPKPQIVVARIDGSRSSRTPYSVGDYRDVADAYVP